MRKITKVWTCKNGSKVRICDMSNSHLLNTIKLLYKTAAKNRNYALCYVPDFQGEMAQYYAEQEWDSLNEMSDLDFAFNNYPILENLIEDAERRKLDINWIYE